MSLDDLQAQLRGTLDQQFAALKQKYEDGLAEARRQAAADAEREAAVKLERARAQLEQARTEWGTQLHTGAAAARAEGGQQASEAAQRERQEHEQKLEQAIDQAVAAARRTAELELESERRRGQNEIESARQKAKAEAATEKQRAQAELDGLRQRMQAEIAAARQAAAAAASAKAATPPPAAPGVPAAAFDRVLAAIRDIDGATTLSQSLESMLTHAGAAAGRAPLFLVNGDRRPSSTSWSATPRRWWRCGPRCERSMCWATATDRPPARGTSATIRERGATRGCWCRRSSSITKPPSAPAARSGISCSGCAPRSIARSGCTKSACRQ